MTISSGSRLSIGKRVVLCSDSRYTALGVGHPVVLRTLASGAALEIGDDVGISGASICSAQAVVIGDGCLIGADAMIFDTAFHPVTSTARRHAPLPKGRAEDAVTIGRNVFVGARAIVLPGSSIGEHAVIAAGSVVRGPVPAGVLAAGNPARPVRELW